MLNPFAQDLPANWQAPWLAEYAALANSLEAQELHQQLNRHAAVSGLCNSHGAPIQFLPQSCLSEGMAYEAHIAATGQVPTRNNWHDAFNAMIWLHYPALKAALNARQAQEIAQAGIGQVRGPVRDAATLFDENAAFFVTSNMALIESLQSMDWRAALFGVRACFGKTAQVRLFGHALLEKLLQPYPAITAHALCIQVGSDYFGWAESTQRQFLDGQLAQWLALQPLSSRDFTPLPILGVPGFWSANLDDDFYADMHVFRSLRRSPCTTRIVLF
ncbi:DUF3025 domain-containing protein [Ampullimonas aquatilis]|uniref:DUF3025 domain-containing protein n=1 Tax=Ampullimonas aquatilis TaxID=1341549 RepID=UPI003C7838E2